MATWNFDDIKIKTRQVCGRLSAVELSENELETRINQFYQFTFPAEVKVDREFTFYELNTLANQQTYAYPTGFTNFVQPATMDNLSLIWYQDPATFEQNNPQQITRLTQWTGDGVTTVFTTTVTGFPILPGTTIITDNTETFTDTNTTYTTSNVNLSSNSGGSGTVNYSTGVVSVTFAVAPVAAQNIYLSYIVFVPGRPQAVLSYDEQFTFYPVPDTVYRFKVQAYKIPPALVNATDVPDRPEWGPCIAYGTARDIHADYAEMDRYQEVTALYKEQLGYVLNRTNQNLLNTRASPNF